MEADAIKFEIVEHFAVLSETKSGWTTELNKVKWNDREAKYDIRPWDPEHKRMGKGITLTQEELVKLRDALNKMTL
ncbi:MAG TPA: YdbC family protein [Spirochaetia bacterium]|nr:YdbC family protein [Spirochaetales bacterium]HPD79802.1 YdbC family protein [Spirochaetales bacterium]HQK33999.1 YdbC family protein [Spirochaetales bacterium]HRS65360.1 YdbC family protein [Spirochaetia bacterium]HRV27870.1 YdbC family protein [Spirochaetia bacterium]